MGIIGKSRHVNITSRGRTLQGICRHGALLTFTHPNRQTRGDANATIETHRTLVLSLLEDMCFRISVLVTNTAQATDFYDHRRSHIGSGNRSDRGGLQLDPGRPIDSAPYSAPERLVLVRSTLPDSPMMTGQGWAAAQWMEWQKEAKSFEAVAAYGWSFNFLVLPEGSESLEGMYVTREYFTAVGVQPVLGRAFLESENGTKLVPVIVLGYELWQRRFKRRSEHHRQENSDQPSGPASDRDWRNAGGRPFSTFARCSAGTQLQRERAGRFLGSREAGPRRI